MAIGIRARTHIEELATRSPVLASAVEMRLSTTGWKPTSRVDEAWQRDSWYYYRIIPGYHYGANWAGDACSRAEIYAADVSEKGVIGDQTDDEEVNAIVDGLFGGPAAKARMISSIAVSLIVAAETYVIGEGGKAGSGKDEWSTVAPYQVRPYRGGIWIGDGTHTRQIPDGSAYVFRIHKPLPEAPWLADAPGMSLLQTLRELEEIQKFKAAQTDSRLANAGIYPIPAGLDFAIDDQTPPGAESLQRAVVEAADASLQGKGSAAQISPIFFEVPPELLPHMLTEPIRFGSIMSDSIKNLEEMALYQLAVGLNIPPEVVLGTGKSTQWSAWEIGESAVKYHIEPLLNLILDAIQVSYFNDALRRIGKNPARFALQADTSALTVRPNRAADALNLYNADVPAISAKALRFYNDFKEADAPSEEEITQRQVQKMMLRDPQLLMDPRIVEASGLDVDVALPVDGVTPPPPIPERVPIEGKQPMPARPGETPIDQSIPMQPPSVISSLVPQPSALLAACDQAVFNTLRVAGNRLLTPSLRRDFEGVPAYELHTKILVKDEDHVGKLTAGAWTGLDSSVEGTGVDPVQLQGFLQAYVSGLLRRSAGHSRGLLASMMVQYGLSPWQN
jgi:hypothetical protein